MSSAPRFQLPFAVFADGNGEPLPNAQLFFYVSGTSTLANTYSNNALTLANPNPVIAASNGQFPNIFLNPALTYKVVLEDQNGNQVWTADPVVQLGSLLGPTLTLQEGAEPAGVASALVIYTPDGETLEYVDGSNVNHIVATQPNVLTTGNFTNANIEVDAGGRIIDASSGSIDLANGAEFTYQVASGTASDIPNSAANAWNRRSFNTTNYNNITGCFLSGNQITIPPGVYLITYRMGCKAKASAGAARGAGRLRDTTNGISQANSEGLEVFGPSVGTGIQAGIIAQSTMLVVASTIVCELDMYTTVAGMTGGTPATTGDSEVYVQLSILQISS